MDFRVTRVRRIFANGRHNAFTGIAAFAGKVFICFRTGEAHVSPDGEITVIASEDLTNWKVVARRTHPDLDLRDPGLVVFGDRLWVNYYSDDYGRRHALQSWSLATTDGEQFSDEQVVDGPPGEGVLWFARPCGDTLYGAAYFSTGDYRGTHAGLFASADGRSWREVLEFPVPGGNEASFDFDADGTLWALVRSDEFGNIPSLCVSEPPYRECRSVRQLPIRMAGPMLKRLGAGCLIICRRWNEPGSYYRRSDVFWLGDGGDIQYLRTLPSGGDTSYAAWLDREDGRALLSYYSSHEYKVDPPPGGDWIKDMPADIFLADIAYR